MTVQNGYANGHTDGVATMEPPPPPATSTEGAVTLADGTTISHDEWLAERDKDFGQGASDLPRIAGLTGSVVKHWYEKKGLIERDRTETEQMRWGKILEPHILDRFAQESGEVVVVRQLFLRHPQYPWLFVTLDALCLGGLTVEAKALSNFGNDAEDGFGWHEDSPPLKWQVQAQQSMAITGEDQVVFACFYGPELAYKQCVVKRDEAMWAELLKVSLAFRQSLIDNEPPTEFVADDAALVGKLYRGKADGPVLELTDSKLLEACQAYHAHADLSEREKSKDKAKAAILQALGTSTKAMINGWTLIRKTTAKQTRIEVLPPG